jgi:hypothetical protein
MKFMSTWKILPGTMREAVDRFLAGQANPPEGVTLLGRWHRVDCSGGYALYETSDVAAFYETAAKWSDVLEMQTVPIVEDAEAGPVLAKVFQK